MTEVKSAPELIAEFDSKPENKTPNYPYVDFISKRRKIVDGNPSDEHSEVFRADCRVASYATKTGIEGLANKGWQIVRYGNFHLFTNTQFEQAPEEVHAIEQLCNTHIGIRKTILQEQAGIEAKKATQDAAAKDAAEKAAKDAEKKAAQDAKSSNTNEKSAGNVK